jgi:hypothetical protein
MKLQHLRSLLGLGLVICLTTVAQADWGGWGGGGGTSGGTSSYISPVQSNYRELGWSLAAQVEVYSCDATAQAFQAVLPSFLTIIGSSLKEGIAFAKANQCQLDPTKLYFYYAYAPRVYFVSNGGAYTDGLGVTIGPAAPSGLGVAPTGSSYTNYNVFPNCNSNATNTYSNKQVGTTRTTFVPLRPGDFVQLPTIQVGQQLSLVLWSNVNSSGVPGNTFYNDATANADKYQHVVAFFPSTTSQYIIVGFEDLYGGGDGDYNDVIVVVDVGPQNAALWLNVSTLPK